MATAAGFLVSLGSGGACPVASWTICQASWFVSRGFFLFASVDMTCMNRPGFIPPVEHELNYYRSQQGSLEVARGMSRPLLNLVG